MSPIKALLFLGLIYQITSWCLRTILSQKFIIQQVDWAPNNAFFVTANKAEQVVRVYNASSYEVIKVYTQGLEPRSVKISKDSRYVAIGYSNSKLTVLQTTTWGFYMGFDTGQTQISQVDFTFDNLSVLTCGKYQRIRSYNLGFNVSQASARNLNYKFVPNNGDIVACRCGPNGQYAFAEASRKLNILTMSPPNVNSLPDAPADVLELDFRPGMEGIIGYITNNNVFRWNSTASLTFPFGSPTDPILGALNYGKTKYMALGLGKSLLIYERVGSVLVANFVDSKNTLSSVKISNDQKFLLTGDTSGQIRVYSTMCGMYGCESGSYNDSNICKKCYDAIPYCVTCKSAAACQNCMLGYFKSGSTCAACHTALDSCLSCKDNTECLKCLDGYYLDSGTKKCLRCPQTGCIECNSSSTCTKCFKNDYYLNTSSNSCRKCSDNLPNCVRCYDANTCVDCQIGFYEDPTTKKCLQCPGNCLACQSSTNCSECKVGYWASSGTCVRCSMAGCISCNQTGVCYDCRQGMFLGATNDCTTCTPPCTTCSVAATNCTGCNVGYYLDSPNFICLKCIQNCKICNQSSKCLNCFPGFKVDSTTFTCKACSNYYNNCSQCSQTLCLRCRDGFYVDTGAGNTCKSCMTAMPRCMSCANQSTCIQCVTSYYTTGVTGVNACGSCGTGCQQCISATNCTNCFSTYFKNSSLMCQPCKNNCFECSSDLVCSSCVVGYYLDGTTCKSCFTIMPYCSVCSSATICVACVAGTYLDDADNKCKLCSLGNCLTCNKTSCFACALGYYLDVATTPNLCKSCPEYCQQCTSASICTSCIDGYYLDSTDKKCKPCSLRFTHCTLCNITMCQQCDKGTELNFTNNNQCALCSSHIRNCKSCYWDYSPATPTVKCSVCNYGFGLTANNLTCAGCNLLKGCVECKSSSLCTKCEVGYYLKNDNTCGFCMVNCLTCANPLSCMSCQDGYVNDSTGCVLCQSKIDGCSKCITTTSPTTFNCTYCQIGYYLNNIDKQCYICHSQMPGCHTCNDSTTCTACLDKYYLDLTGGANSCEKCFTAIPGCQICNSSSVCISCEDSYYLDIPTSKCYFCSKNIPGCLHCANNTVCSQCESGYFLTTGNICNLCQSVIQGCIYCNSQTYCFQCRTGYYLNPTDNKCYECSQSGCQVCSSNSPALCITCNSNYYLVGNMCNTCNSRVAYCDECNATHCLQCDVGYYLLSPTVCSTCSSTMNGCSRCVNAITCLQCMSSYFVNSSHKCQECNDAILGCQNCLDGSVCISCEANFYLNSTTNKCQTCTDITGCLLCKNQTVCVMCQEKYFMSGTQCKLCSAVLKGCFSCVTDHVCVQCQTGYVLDPVSYECKVNTVQAKQAVQGLKLVTYYISKDMLKHVLLAKGTTFKKTDKLNITENGLTTMFVEDYTGKQVELKVLSYEYGAAGNSLVFFTDNPLATEMQDKSRQMAFRRLQSASSNNEFVQIISRLLAVELNLQVMVKMSPQVYRQILPELDYSGSVTIGYSLNNPQFMNSYMSVQTGNRYVAYQAVGIVAILLFLINYVLKFLFTMPQSRNRSTILPHIIALKSCCLILYPSHFEYISFCKGFMIVDFPWLNSIIATKLTDLSDTVQVPFGLFFQNMSIAGTYLLGFLVYVVLVLTVHAYFYVTQEQSSSQGATQKDESQMQDQQSREKQFKIQTLESAMGINYDNDESTSNKTLLTKKNFLQLLWNIFTFSMVYYSCLCVQGAFINYSQILSLNGSFYIMGMLIFIYVTTQTFYAFSRNSKNIHKVRIYLKAFLLSLAHYNPIYIVSVAVIIDIILVVLQFFVINRQNQFSKLFTLTHVLSSVMIGLMIFVSESLISIVTTAISLAICFGFEVYIHVKEYQNAKKNIHDEDFKMDQDNENHKPSADDDQPFDWANNVWDLNKRSHHREPENNIHMYATMEAFGKSDGFEMENVEIQRQAQNQNRPQTSLTTVKPGGRKSKHKKTHEAMRSNTIQVIPNQKQDPREKFWGNIMKDNFSSEDVESNSNSNSNSNSS